jgi:hypothetical protein
MAEQHGPPRPPGPKTFEDTKSSSTDYRANCKRGFVAMNFNAHHVIPCVSLSVSLASYLKGKTPEYREALDYYTKWDVNEEANMMGLPVFETYVAVFHSMEKKQGLSVGPPRWQTVGPSDPTTPKYPIHIPAALWGHTDYNVLVETDLDDVWTKLQVTLKKHEFVKGNDLRAEIQRVSDSYRRKLMRKNKQTLEDWKAKKYDQFRMD